MKTIRTLFTTIPRAALTLVAAILLAVSGAGLACAADEAPLAIKVYNADGNSFHVNSVLVTGKTEAVLVDAQFTRADAHKLAAEILSSGKKLTAVYISHGDPDYYFGLEVIKQEFPEVKVYATAQTVEWIKKTVEKKVGFWGPKMGNNAPKSPVIPEVLPGTSLMLEGQKLEVLGLDGEMPGRTCLWIPSIRAIVGGVNVFGNLHAWTADTQSKAQRAAWVRVLEKMEAMKPAIVIPGHAKSISLTGVEQVRFSKAYLQRFEQELDSAPTAAALIDTMKRLYPDAGLAISLEIGAKVNKGEMKW